MSVAVNTERVTDKAKENIVACILFLKSFFPFLVPESSFASYFYNVLPLKTCDLSTVKFSNSWGYNFYNNETFLTNMFQDES